MDGRRAWTSIAVLAFAFCTSIGHAQPGGASAGAAAPATRSTDRPQRLSRIIGMDIVNRQGEKIGDIEDLVLDRQGNVAWAVVSTGAFLGVGERLHAVPWKSLQAGPGIDNFVLDIDRERLRSAPGFDRNTFPDLNDARWSAENRRHFPATASSTVGRDTSPPNVDRARGSTNAGQSGSRAKEER